MTDLQESFTVDQFPSLTFDYQLGDEEETSQEESVEVPKYNISSGLVTLNEDLYAESPDKEVICVNVRIKHFQRNLDKRVPVGSHLAISKDNLLYVFQEHKLRVHGLHVSLDQEFDHYGKICDLQVSHDGTKIASCDEEGVVNIWNSDEQGIVREVSLFFNNQLKRVTWHPFTNDILVVTVGVDIFVIFLSQLGKEDRYDVPDMQEGNYFFRITLNTLDIALSQKYLALATEDGYIYVWDLQKKCCLSMLEAHSSPVDFVHFLKPYENILVSASYEANEIKVISIMPSIKQIQTIKFDYSNLSDKSYFIKFTPDDSVMFVTLNDTSAIWGFGLSANPQDPRFVTAIPLFFPAKVQFVSSTIGHLTENNDFEYAYLSKRGVFYFSFNESKFISEKPNLPDVLPLNMTPDEPPRSIDISNITVDSDFTPPEDYPKTVTELKAFSDNLFESLSNEMKSFRGTIERSLHQSHEMMYQQIDERLNAMIKEEMKKTSQVIGDHVLKKIGDKNWNNMITKPLKQKVHESLDAFVKATSASVHEKIKSSNALSSAKNQFNSQFSKVLIPKFEKSCDNLTQNLATNMTHQVDTFRDYIHHLSAAKVDELMDELKTTLVENKSTYSRKADISDDIQKRDYKSAFVKTLQKRKEGSIYKLCTRLNVSDVFGNNAEILPTSVLIGIAQQLSIDLNDNLRSKLTWISNVISQLGNVRLTSTYKKYIKEIYNELKALHPRKMPSSTKVILVKLLDDVKRILE